MSEASIKSLGQLADRIEAASTGEKVSTGDVVEAIGKRSLHPLLLVPALLAATPLSGIPGLSALCGLAIAAISAQLLLSFDTVRLPGFITRCTVDSSAMREALDKARPVIGRIDRYTRNDRLAFLFKRPLIYIPELLCLASGLVMPFLEFIPFSASIVATGVLFLALSMMTRDGLFFLLAMVPYGGFLYLLITRLL